MQFKKILMESEMPTYSAGKVDTAYRLEDGSIVGHCRTTKEWLKWSPRGALHDSCADDRLGAALLDFNYGSPVGQSSLKQWLKTRLDKNLAMDEYQREQLWDLYFKL